jgi:transposase
MMKNAPALTLRRGDKQKLAALTRRRNVLFRDAQRARIILLASQGYSNMEISRLTDVHRNQVIQWRNRYEHEGLNGLGDRARSGRPTVYKTRDIQKVVHTVCRKPPKGLSRWSVRTLSEHLDMAVGTVHSILKENDLHPHRLRTFTFSPDPQFEEKLLDVVGLYMNPPRNALILCIDEKTGIQALDRTQPMLPLRSKKARSWTNEYVRHGTRTMLASLEIETGKVTAMVKNNRRSETFLAFMDVVVRQYTGKRLCVVLDNLNIHTNSAAQQWLKKHANVSFHYTPKHASWVNLIECFFSILTRQGLQQSVHKSGRALERFLREFIDQYNKHCGPFTWTKGPKKLKRIIELTKDYQAAHLH